MRIIPLVVVKELKYKYKEVRSNTDCIRNIKPIKQTIHYIQHKLELSQSKIHVLTFTQRRAISWSCNWSEDAMNE